MYQKLIHDGENSLPFQLFMAPRSVKLDTWRLDFERVDSLIQDAFWLFSASPFAVGRITSRLEKAERGLSRINVKLEVLAREINDRVQAMLPQPSDSETWELRYDEFQQKEKNAVAAWTMTLPETQKQIELGLIGEDILGRRSWVGMSSFVEDGGVPVDSMDGEALDSDADGYL